MSKMDQKERKSVADGIVVVFAKCPLPGKSKTRLIPMLGEEGSSQLAKAMLSDVLCSLVNHEPLQRIGKVLCYGPPTEEGRQQMNELLKELEIYDSVRLIPMLHGDLKARDLGDQLQNALTEAKLLTSGPIMFVGMDSPELPLDELQTAFSFSDHATLCPSQDGGYGMLAVPNNAPPAIFDGVLWSHPLTALSQLKSISDARIPTRLGRIMQDMDEPEDVQVLFRNLIQSSTETVDFKSLQVPSSNLFVNSACPYSTKALQELKVLICNYRRHT